MGESRTGFWATISLLLVVAIVFIILWFMRGGEIDTLTQTLSQEQRSRSDDVSRLESNLSSLQYDLDSTKRRLDETTTQLDSERTRANQARQEADRLSREQLGQTGSSARLERELASLKESLAMEQTAKAELENRAATAEAALIAARKGLEDELTDLRTDVQIKRGAIENLVSKVAELESQVKTASAAAASGDESGLIAQLRSQLEELTANNTSLTSKLETVNKQVESITSERDKLASDLKASSHSLEEIRSQVGSQPQAVAADGSSDAERIAALTKQLEERTATAAAAGSAEAERIAALTQQLEERTAAAEVAGRRIEELEKYLEEANRAAADNSAADQIAALTQQVKEKEAAADRSRAEAEAADRRLEEMETRIEYSNHLEDTLTKLNEEMAVIRSDRDNAIEAMSKLQTEYDKQLSAEKQKVAAFADRLSAYQGKADVLEGRLSEMTSMVEEYQKVYGQAAPVRQVAEVVDAMYSNKTVVINIGGNQRVKPGMKFDVYRPVGDRNRYLGMVHVVKVNADTALALSSFRAERVMVCPVTGFAVLEPGARFSPFTKGKDGSPVELVEMDSLDIPVEAPGIGDILASPFYSPEKAFSFAVQDSDAFAYGEAQVIVDTLGGIYRPWETKDAVDFAVVSGDKVDTGSLKGNAVAVSADYVKRYYQPLAVETSSMPCIVCP